MLGGSLGSFIEHFFSSFFLHKQRGVWDAKEYLGEGLANGGKEGATEMRVLRCSTVWHKRNKSPRVHTKHCWLMDQALPRSVNGNHALFLTWRQVEYSRNTGFQWVHISQLPQRGRNFSVEEGATKRTESVDGRGSLKPGKDIVLL